VCLQLGGICLQLREFLSVNLATGRDDGEGHQDIGSCERSTAKILAVVRRRRELGVKEAKVSFVVRVEVHAVDLVGDSTSDGLNEEGDWGVADVCAGNVG